MTPTRWFPTLGGKVKIRDYFTLWIFIADARENERKHGPDCWAFTSVSTITNKGHKIQNSSFSHWLHVEPGILLYMQSMKAAMTSSNLNFQNRRKTYNIEQMCCKWFVESFIKIGPSVWAVEMTYTDTDTHRHRHTYIHTHTHTYIRSDFFSRIAK